VLLLYDAGLAAGIQEPGFDSEFGPPFPPNGSHSAGLPLNHQLPSVFSPRAGNLSQSNRSRAVSELEVSVRFFRPFSGLWTLLHCHNNSLQLSERGLLEETIGFLIALDSALSSADKLHLQIGPVDNFVVSVRRNNAEGGNEKTT
jgi:hypothetical protein